MSKKDKIELLRQLVLEAYLEGFTEGRVSVLSPRSVGSWPTSDAKKELEEVLKDDV